MLSTGNIAPFRRTLLHWYDASRRDLPWRRTKDPYRIWLSEIMLQQTRVAAVIGHYRRFLDRFPTVHALAGASQESVLAAWSGLGYYSRARRMHAAAKTIVGELQGEFPRGSIGLLELPGIGRYTAAAIASSRVNQMPGASSNHDGFGNVTSRSFTQVSGTLTVC